MERRLPFKKLKPESKRLEKGSVLLSVQISPAVFDGCITPTAIKLSVKSIKIRVFERTVERKEIFYLDFFEGCAEGEFD